MQGMQQQIASRELPKTKKKRNHIRADITRNKKVLMDMFKVVFSFFVICYTFKVLPQAHDARTYSPQKWTQVDVFNIGQVNPLNRNLKIFISAANKSQEMDHFFRVEVYSVKDDEEIDKVLDVKVMDLGKYQVVEDGETKFYIGDVHVLDKASYRVKVFKNRKLANGRKLQQLSDQSQNQEATVVGGQNEQTIPPLLQQQHNEQQNNQNQELTQNTETIKQTNQNNAQNTEINNQITNTQQNQNQKTQNSNQDQQNIQNIPVDTPTNTQQGEQKQNSETKQSLSSPESPQNPTQQQNNPQQPDNNNQQQEHQQQTQEQKQKRQQQEEQAKKREQQQQKRIQQQEQKQRKQRQQEQKRRKQQQQIKKKEEEQHRKQLQKTNILIQARLKSNFSTIFELVIRYISVLIIIYAAADNPQAPAGIWIIAAITTNPLLVMHVSYPNQISNIFDSFCSSGPLLYACLWLYFIHKKLKYQDAPENIVYLVIKMSLGFTLYFFNVLRRLHFDVLIWETLAAVAVCIILGIYLWQGYLNLRTQYHRDVIIGTVSIIFLVNIFVFQQLSRDWSTLMIYIVMQVYAIYLIYLLGAPKHQLKKSGKDNQIQHIGKEMVNYKDGSHSERGNINTNQNDQAPAIYQQEIQDDKE